MHKWMQFCPLLTFDSSLQIASWSKDVNRVETLMEPSFVNKVITPGTSPQILGRYELKIQFVISGRIRIEIKDWLCANPWGTGWAWGFSWNQTLTFPPLPISLWSLKFSWWNSYTQILIQCLLLGKLNKSFISAFKIMEKVWPICCIDQLISWANP